jgi:hypothetical protein
MYNLYAKIPQTQICKDRQYAGLLRWAAYIGALAIPTERPDEQFVANKLLAQRIPPQVLTYVESTISLTVADPGIQTNVRQHLHAYNDEATELQMNAQVDSALSANLPLYSKTLVSQSEIDQWYNDHGFVTSPPTGMIR